MKKVVTLSLLLLHGFLIAQNTGHTDIEEMINAYEAKLDSIDKKTIKTKYLLNKGFMFAGTLEDYFEYAESGEDAFTKIGRSKFRRIYNGLRKSDLKSKNNKRLPKYDFRALRLEYKEKRNTIPLGIIQAKGEFLDSIQIENHLEKVANGLPIEEEYKKYFIFSAGALKKKAYSGDVTFEVVPGLFHLQNPNSIKSLEIDFADGRGFLPLDENSSFSVQYESTGEKAIAIRFKQKRRTFTSYSTIKIVTLNQEQPDMSFNINGNVSSNAKSANKIASTTSSPRSSSSVSGGSAKVFLGCDLIFDQPVIVIEGFDPVNEDDEDDLRRNYRNSAVEQDFRANGHDMVYFNFQDGGADMNINASHVEDLIELVNREKQGNQDIIIIGESMGGIVARLAIRGMEMQGETHNISHYISFDAPHKGANVPLGFQAFLHGANRIQPVRNLAEEDFDEALAQITAPAAKQLLLQYYEVNGLGNPIGDERAPHPNFIAMQNELDRIGFPSQGGIRNLAIVNGALNGSAASNRVRATTPGERILDLEDTYDAWLALLKFEGKVRTNHFNRSTQLMHFEIKGIGIRLNSAELNLDLGNVNYDLGAGGLVDDELVLEEIEDIDDLRLVGNGFRNFSFVPLFSSLASTRNITNQTELNRSYAFLDNRGQIPFDEAFGRNENTEHINAADIAGQWNDLLRLELGLNTVTTCNQIPTMNIAPPTPRSNAPFFYTCQNSGGDVTFFVADDPDPFGNQYVHSWKASGPRTLTGNGNTFTMRSTLPAGVYTVRLTRSFSTETIEDLPSNSRNRVRSSSSSRAFSVLTSSNRICSGGGGPGPGPGGGIPLTINLEDFDMEGKGEIVVWPNPTNEIINVSYKVGEESEVSVSLLSINGGYGAISLGSKSRLPGEYTDSFDVGQVAVGVYVLVVDINGDGMEKKIIIN